MVGSRVVASVARGEGGDVIAGVPVKPRRRSASFEPGVPIRRLTAGFRRNGYVVLARALGRRDLADLNHAFDRELLERPELWTPRDRGRLDNWNVLLATDAFDRIFLNRPVLRIVKALMGPDVCVDECLLMIRGPAGEDDERVWHRDMDHAPEHPLALRYLSLMYYLTDVDETTHCFAIVPEDVSAKRACPQDADGSGAREIHGKAGTAILFNAGSCHAAVVRRTPSERRTAHVYFGHASDPCISNDTIVPARLLRAPRRPVRQLFRRVNVITQLVRQHC